MARPRGTALRIGTCKSAKMPTRKPFSSFALPRGFDCAASPKLNRRCMRFLSAWSAPKPERPLSDEVRLPGGLPRVRAEFQDQRILAGQPDDTMDPFSLDSM